MPVKVAGWAVATDLQNGEPAYDRFTVGSAVMVTDVVAVTAAQPPDAGVV